MVTFTHPTISDFINDALACAIAAGGTAVITAALSNPILGYGLFYPAWKTCLLLKVSNRVVSEIQVKLHNKDYYGNWSGH